MISISNKKDCKDCLMKIFCKRNKAKQSIIEKCNNLDFIERVNFANDNNLVPKIDSYFADFFWNYHDLIGLKITLQILKENFENPTRSFPNINPQIIKDNIFIETLMKFCKLSEDFGALIISKDKDKYKFLKNYNEYKVYDVTSFYEKSTFNENQIRNIFSYPIIENQKSEEAKKVLEMSYQHTEDHLTEIKEDYLKYRKVYNSYKHGYKIRFNVIRDLTLNPNSKEEKKYSKALLYYDKDSLKKVPLSVQLIAFEKYNDFYFDIVHNSCISILMLIQVLLNNFMNFQEKPDKQDILLFFNPYLMDLLNDFIPKNIEFT